MGSFDWSCDNTCRFLVFGTATSERIDTVNCWCRVCKLQVQRRVGSDYLSDPTIWNGVLRSVLEACHILRQSLFGEGRPHVRGIFPRECIGSFSSTLTRISHLRFDVCRIVQGMHFQIHESRDLRRDIASAFSSYRDVGQPHPKPPTSIHSCFFSFGSRRPNQPIRIHQQLKMLAARWFSSPL